MTGTASGASKVVSWPERIDTIDLTYYTVADGDGQTQAAGEAAATPEPCDALIREVPTRDGDWPRRSRTKNRRGPFEPRPFRRVLRPSYFVLRTWYFVLGR